MGSSPHHWPKPPSIETSRETAERLWREQFDEEEMHAINRLRLRKPDVGQSEVKNRDLPNLTSDRAEARAPPPRSPVAETHSSPRVQRIARRKGSSVPSVPPPTVSH